MEIVLGIESSCDETAAALVRADRTVIAQRIASQDDAHRPYGGVGPEIAAQDAEIGLTHALALHYKSVELNKALKAAELALGDDPSEETFERLRDIQNQITTVDGTEALIEGFGSLSGRATRSF